MPTNRKPAPPSTLPSSDTITAQTKGASSTAALTASRTGSTGWGPETLHGVCPKWQYFAKLAQDVGRNSRMLQNDAKRLSISTFADTMQRRSQPSLGLEPRHEDALNLLGRADKAGMSAAGSAWTAGTTPTEDARKQYSIAFGLYLETDAGKSAMATVING